MALINCPECQKEISDQAKTCPHCGLSVQKELAKKKAEEEKKRVEELAKNASPTINAISHIVVFVIIALIIGVIVYACNKPTYDSDDGKCDICGKKKTYDLYGEEYCDKHVGDAIDYYLK